MIFEYVGSPRPKKEKSPFDLYFEMKLHQHRF